MDATTPRSCAAAICPGNRSVGCPCARDQETPIWRHSPEKLWYPNREGGHHEAAQEALGEDLWRLRQSGDSLRAGWHYQPVPKEFLRRALNWALTIRRRDGTPLLERHALQGYPVPKTVSPRRPVADYDRYLALRAVADDVDAQRLFGPFLDLVAGLGWRVSAVCQLRASDFSPQHTDTAPFGRLRKRGETDKEAVEMWVPISGEIRAALATLLERNPVAGETPLFPAPQGSNKAPWTRYHARSVLQRAEKRAGLTPLEGGDFHPYRRAWATARKHLPLVDVASAGGWKSTATLLRCYMQPDEATLYRVVSESVKLRRIGAQS